MLKGIKLPLSIANKNAGESKHIKKIIICIFMFVIFLKQILTAINKLIA
jgi:hypothetical protein